MFKFSDKWFTYIASDHDPMPGEKHSRKAIHQLFNEILCFFMPTTYRDCNIDFGSVHIRVAYKIDGGLRYPHVYLCTCIQALASSNPPVWPGSHLLHS